MTRLISVVYFVLAVVAVWPGDVFLSDIPEATAQTGWFGLVKDRFGPRSPFVLAGAVVPKGLLTHAPAEVIYTLDGAFRRFRAEAGLFDSGVRVGRPVAWQGGTEFRDADGSVQFQVWTDGTLAYQSPVLRWADTAAVDVPVLGVRALRLVVLPVDTDASDWAVWGNARLERTGALDPLAVTGGLIQGHAGKSPGMVVYQGIPYAAPPVGSLRWRPPAPVVPWTGVRDARAFGPSPMQGEALPFEMWTAEYQVDNTRGPAGYSEDCLTLNVWNPASDGMRRPVVVFLPGGAYAGGGSSAEVYDGEALAAKGVVVVTINYRVGIFGFLALGALSAESPSQVSGNYGILDQIAALQWVKANIAALGGDPSRVTLQGQSAGADSAAIVLGSPAAKGLVHRAILQSYDSLQTRLPSLAEAERAGLAATGGRSLAQLRAMPAQDLLSLPFQPSPNLDGQLIVRQWVNTLKTQTPVPLLQGMVAGDRLFFGLLPLPFGFTFPKAFTRAALQSGLRSAAGDLADAFARVYPVRTDAEALSQLVQISQDKLDAGLLYQAQLRSLRGTAPTYLYAFTRAMPDATGGQKYGAFHSSDLAYTFGNLTPLRRAYWQNEDRLLAGRLLTYWSQFIKTGDPNGEGLPAWAPYRPGDRSVQGLDIQILPRSLTLDRAEVWQQYYHGVP